MRLLAPAALVVLAALVCPPASEAQLVTMKATGAVASSPYATTPSDLAALFPVGTPIEVTYTFDSAAVDLRSESEFGSYPSSVVSVKLRIGMHEQLFTTGDIGVMNDNPSASLNMDGACNNDPTLRPSPFVKDSYWMEGRVPAAAAAPIPGYSAEYAYFDVEEDCGLNSNPGTIVSSDAITALPRMPSPPWPGSGIWLGWRDANGFRAELFGLLSSLAVVPPANTATGSGVTVVPTLPPNTSGSVSLSFDSVQSGGDTTVTTTGTPGPPPPAGFKLTNPPLYFDIQTTATFTGDVRVCLGWTQGQIANENRVSIFHHENGQWVDITDPTSRDTVNNKVCGTASSLSPFTLFDVKYPFTGFFSPVENAPTMNAVKAGAAVPVKFSLGGDLGLNIFAAGSPSSQLMQCDTLATVGEISETVLAGGSSLSYDPQSAQYTYVWKTDKAWGGSCRELQLKLTDGETYRARFTFRK